MWFRQLSLQVLGTILLYVNDLMELRFRSSLLGAHLNSFTNRRHQLEATTKAIPFIRLLPSYPPHLTNPSPRFSTTPMTMAIFRLGLNIPVSLVPQIRQPRGQKKPIVVPQIMSSNAPLPSSSPALTPPPPPSKVVMSLPRPPPPSLELSSHWSSRARSVLGLGIVSGVCVCAWIDMNWSRRDCTSDVVKPAVRRRSKPRGMGVVVVVVVKFVLFFSSES